jgi:tripartite-type tricarboxylate transporter receptor subunit TctC
VRRSGRAKPEALAELFEPKDLAAMKLGRVFVALAVLLVPVLAAAENWPAQPIRIVVSSGAGGTADILARMMGDRLSPLLGQPVVIEDRPGAGGHLGADERATNPFGGAALVQASHLRSDARCAAGQHDRGRPQLVGGQRVAAGADARGSCCTCAREAGAVDLFFGWQRHVRASRRGTAQDHGPYRYSPRALQERARSGDRRSGRRRELRILHVPSVLPQVEAGKLRALAITSASRSVLVPNVPTVAEEGFPGFEVLAWYALFAPRGTPEPVVARLDADLEKILQMPDVRDKMAELGAEPRDMGAAELTRFVEIESPKWGELIRASGTAAE